MDNGDHLLCCKRCGSFLAKQHDQYICFHCSQAYPVKDDIILMEEKDEGTDLRMSKHLLNIHGLKDERKYYGTYIKSDVEHAGRLHSIHFPNFHTQLLSSYLSDSIVLDLGCGQLPYIDSFTESDIKAFYGLDLSMESLVIARQNFKKKFPLILVKHSVERTPFRDASFDVVISSEVLEHLDTPQNYLREIYRLTKKGGYLSLSAPCTSLYFYPHNLLYIVARPGRWYKLIHSHNYWKEALSWHAGLRPSILRMWMKEAGFSIVRHETRLWYYHTPLRPMWRLFLFIERIGILSAGKIFLKYLELMDALLAKNIPVIKWLGIRQFILCRKER